MATLTIRIPDAHRDRWAAGYVLGIAIDLDPVALSILDVGVGLKLLRGTLQRSANQAPAQVVGPVALPCIEDLECHQVRMLRLPQGETRT